MSEAKGRMLAVLLTLRVKTRKEACPPAFKHLAEVDVVWHEKIKEVGSVQARGRIHIWTEKENGEEAILSNLKPRQQNHSEKRICPD
jgi:hypothetical protein